VAAAKHKSDVENKTIRTTLEQIAYIVFNLGTRRLQLFAGLGC